MTRRVGRRARLLSTTLTLASIAVTTPSASAQAWVPPAGLGAVTVAIQTIDYDGHLVTDGTFFPVGQSINNRVDIEFDYAFTDRLSVTAGLPLIFAKYVDPNPLPPFVPFLEVDACRCWQSGWQDFGVTARYNVINGAFALTPSVSVGVPSHDYNFLGEAAVGNRLKELRFTIDAGQRLDAISPRLSVQGRYSYAFVERVIDVPNNRSNATVEAGFLMTRRLVARGLLSWQHVHGGLRLGSPGSALPPPGEVNTPERMFHHDRLLRDNNWRIGGGIAYSLPSMDVFASYVEFVKGTDSHAGRAFTAGVSWPFEVRRGPAP